MYKLNDAPADFYEEKYYSLFLNNDFPNYEIFWAKFIAPKTNRPFSINWKNDVSENFKYISQLHYTVFFNLVRAYQILNDLDKSDQVYQRFLFQDFIVRIASAIDCADELLGRVITSNYNNLWDYNSSKRIRGVWREHFGNETIHLRQYRNQIVHGCIWLSLPNLSAVPKIEHIDLYVEWDGPDAVSLENWVKANKYAHQIWNEYVTDYINSHWQKMLTDNKISEMEQFL